jgi:hypothetical protein
LKICESITTKFSGLLNKHAFLNRYSVIPRYPNELQINDDEINICLRYALDIKEFVSKLIDDAENFNDIKDDKN